MEQRVAFAQEGIFAGWPANNGIWVWEDQEILTGCSTGRLLVQPGHNIDVDVDSILLRSKDGGETWAAERPGNYVGDQGALRVLNQALDFSTPGLALRMIGSGYHGCEEKRGGFYASLDRGAALDRALLLNGLQESSELRGLALTPRTDYLVFGAAECLGFPLRARPGKVGFRPGLLCTHARWWDAVRI